MAAAWDGLQRVLDRAALLRTSTGRLILCLEADATHANSNLSLDNAAQGFRQIEAAMRRQLGESSWHSWWNLGSARSATARDSKFRTLRVFLGDTSVAVPVGNGDTLTVRERAIMRSEMDVVIDSRAPLLERVLSWVESVSAAPSNAEHCEDLPLSSSPETRPAILFDTNDESYIIQFLN